MLCSERSRGQGALPATSWATGQVMPSVLVVLEAGQQGDPRARVVARRVEAPHLPKGLAKPTLCQRPSRCSSPSALTTIRRSSSATWSVTPTARRTWSRTPATRTSISAERSQGGARERQFRLGGRCTAVSHGKQQCSA